MARLHILKWRRVLGAAFVFLMYGLSAAVYLRIFIVVGHTVSSAIEIKARIILVCAIIVTPYILIPCLFDKFPRWVVETHHPNSLKYMSRWFFGLPD
jgi:hypothetical protein